MVDSSTINIPDLGEVEEAEVIEICVEVGQSVESEDPIMVLETDKAAISLEKSTTHKGRVDVKCKLSRGFRFDNFSFEINEYELPFVVGEIYDPLEGFVRKQPINKKIPF